MHDNRWKSIAKGPLSDEKTNISFILINSSLYAFLSNMLYEKFLKNNIK